MGRQGGDGHRLREAWAEVRGAEGRGQERVGDPRGAPSRSSRVCPTPCTRNLGPCLGEAAGGRGKR